MINTDKNLPKRKTTRLKGANYDFAGVIFLTLCTKNRKCILSRVINNEPPNSVQIELTPIGKIAKKYICQLNDFYDDITIENYVIMPNHIHLLLFINPNASNSATEVNTVDKRVQSSVLSRFVSTFKRFSNKDVGKNIWQYRSYDHIIRNYQDYQTHLTYILENPMRWYYDELYSDT